MANEFGSFPNNKIAALTLLYMQNQDLSSLSPESVLDKYDEVYKKLFLHQEKKRKKRF